MTDKAYAVPLHELLANVPKSARLVITDPDGKGTRFIPVGRYCHEAAETLRAKLNEPELAQLEPDPRAFYVYKPMLPRGNLGNVADGDFPWIYDQDPSSGYSARMLVYPASSAQGENNETNARASD